MFTSLAALFDEWLTKRAGNVPLTVIDYFAPDVVYVHSAVYRLLIGREPSRQIHWVHGHTLARRMECYPHDTVVTPTFIRLGIFNAANDQAEQDLEALLSGPRAAFIVSFYEHSLTEIVRSSAILFRILADFFDRCVAQGHIVVCCASRPLLLIDEIRRLFTDRTFAVVAGGYYEDADPLPPEVALAIPDAAHPLFMTRSQALRCFVKGFICRAKTRPLDSFALASELIAAGFYETGFRLRTWSATKNEHAPIPLSLDVYAPDSPLDDGIVGIADDCLHIPELARNSCLSGNAGSGKTTTLSYIVRHWAVPSQPQLADDSYGWMPIMLAVGSNDIVAALRESLRPNLLHLSRDRTFTPETLGSQQTGEFPDGINPTLLNVKWLFFSPVLLIVDDFDKVEPSCRRALETQIQEFRLSNPASAVLVACRKGHEPALAGLTKFFVRPLSNAQGKALLWALKSKLDFDVLAGSHQKAIVQFVRNPFLLTMLARTIVADNEIPGLSLYTLVDRYLKRVLLASLRDESIDNELITLALNHWLPLLGIEMRQGKLRSIATIPQETVEFASRAGILRLTNDSTGVAFCHSFIHDYFVAIWLLRNAEGRKILDFLPTDSGTLLHWRNTFRILFGVLQPDTLAVLVERLAMVEPTVAAECLGDRSDLWKSPAGERVIETLCAKAQSFEGVGPDERVAAARTLGWMDPRISWQPQFTKGLLRVGGREGTKTFWAERYPVTNMQYAAFIRDEGYHRRQFWREEGWSWRLAGHIECPLHWQELDYNAPNMPVLGVSLHEAFAYCNWLNSECSVGWHIPTNEQWTQMAFSPDPRLFTTVRRLIADHYPGAMKGLDKTSMAELERKVRDIVSTFARELDQYQEQLASAELTPIGVFPPNALGLHDMFCHVWYWVDSWASTRPTRPSTHENVGEPVIVRGGLSDTRHPFSLLFGGWFDAGTRFDRIGFRVCAARKRKLWPFRRQR